MPRSNRRLLVYLLLPYALAVPPLVAGGYLLARRAFDDVALEVGGAAALEEARGFAARLPADLPAEALAEHCRDVVRGSATRLTVITAGGSVLCDTAADRRTMGNHLQRPEIAEALRSGAGVARRESTTVHDSFVYAAARAGEGPEARVIRVAIPVAVLGGSSRRLNQMVAPAILFTITLVLLPVLYISNRIGWRLERMVRFSRTVAGGEFTTRLPVIQRDELGSLEANLSEMGEKLRQSFHGLREETEKIQGVLGAMVEGVVVIAPTGETILINRRAEAIFGLPDNQDQRGRYLVEVCRDPELQELLRATVDGTMEGPHRREIALADAERRFLSVSIAPLSDASGTRFGYVLVFHDITDLKKLETIRRDFVANVSHELRTPLTAIRGYAETLLAGAIEDRKRARQFLSVIDRHSERLSRLIDDLLTLSDLELGKTALKKEPVQLAALVDEVLEVLGEKATRGRVTLTKGIPEDLPLLLGDADRLQQVLINLTDNAVKYTPAGGRVTVAARAAPNGPAAAIEVEVSDSGIGIPAEDLPRLTERFYRVDKARSRELGGTGLGLAIVKHIVQAHGGRLQITSEVNVGTSVRFSVPAWAPPTEA